MESKHSQQEEVRILSALLFHLGHTESCASERWYRFVNGRGYYMVDEFLVMAALGVVDVEGEISDVFDVITNVWAQGERTSEHMDAFWAKLSVSQSSAAIRIRYSIRRAIELASFERWTIKD